MGQPAEPTGAATEAPAESFSVADAFKEAQQAVEPTGTDTPTSSTPDSKAETPSPATTTEQEPSGEEPKSNRQAGREAYERGLREGREAAQRELEQQRSQREAEDTSARQRQEFDELLREASLPADGTYETDQRRSEAQRKLGALYASNTVTRTAYDRGRADHQQQFWGGFEGRLGTELGLDDAGVRSLMHEAPTALDFAKRLVDHGKATERSVWEPEIARRDAEIESLKGKLAGRTPSPEAGSGLRTNGAARDVKTLEDAYAVAKAMHAGT